MLMSQIIKQECKKTWKKNFQNLFTIMSQIPSKEYPMNEYINSMEIKKDCLCMIVQFQNLKLTLCDIMLQDFRTGFNFIKYLKIIS